MFRLTLVLCTTLMGTDANTSYLSLPVNFLARITVDIRREEYLHEQHERYIHWQT